MTYFSTQRSRSNDTTNCYIYLSMLPYKTFILNRDTLTIVALYPKSCINLTFHFAPYNQNQSWCLIRANDGVTNLHFGCIPSMCRCSYVNYIISAWQTFMQLLKTDQTRDLWEIPRGLQNKQKKCLHLFLLMYSQSGKNTDVSPAEYRPNPRLILWFSVSALFSVCQGQTAALMSTNALTIALS